MGQKGARFKSCALNLMHIKLSATLVSHKFASYECKLRFEPSIVVRKSYFQSGF
jgi:hypothetical protein